MEDERREGSIESTESKEGLLGRSRSAGGWREGERISSKFHFSWENLTEGREFFLPLVDRKDVTPFGGLSSVVCGCLLVLVWKREHPKLSPDSLMVQCWTSLIFLLSIQTPSPSLCLFRNRKKLPIPHIPFPQCSFECEITFSRFFSSFFHLWSHLIREKSFFHSFLLFVVCVCPLVFCCAFLFCSVLSVLSCSPSSLLPPSLSFLFWFIGLEWLEWIEWGTMQHNIDKMKKEEDPRKGDGSRRIVEEDCNRALDTHTVSSRITLQEKGQRVSLRRLSYRTLSGHKNMSFSSFLKMKEGKDAWKRKDNQNNKKFPCSCFRYRKKQDNRLWVDCVRWCRESLPLSLTSCQERLKREKSIIANRLRKKRKILTTGHKDRNTFFLNPPTRW